MSSEVIEEDQAAMAAKALALKEAGAAPVEHSPAPRRTDEGFKSIPRADYPPLGAFDAEGHRPVL